MASNGTPWALPPPPLSPPAWLRGTWIQRTAAWTKCNLSSTQRWGSKWFRQISLSLLEPIGVRKLKPVLGFEPRTDGFQKRLVAYKANTLKPLKTALTRVVTGFYWGLIS